MTKLPNCGIGLMGQMGLIGRMHRRPEVDGYQNGSGRSPTLQEKPCAKMRQLLKMPYITPLTSLEKAEAQTIPETS